MGDRVDVRFEIRRFLGEELRRDLSALSDADSLLEVGILDSLGVLELVGFIERQYAVVVTEDEMMPENFDTVDAIVDFVQRRRSAAGD